MKDEMATGCPSAARSWTKAIVQRVFLDKTDHTGIQFIRYTFVGGVAFAADFGTLYLLTSKLHVYYLLSAALAFTLGVLVNYALSVVWVFTQRRLTSRGAEFAIFAVIGLVGLSLNELVMWLLTDIAGCHYLVSKIVSTGVVYLWNFSARKYLLFRK